MGVIVDTGIQKEIDQLEAKGAFSLADTFRQASQISLESLAFMTNVPPEYEALIASSSAYQAVRAQRDEKTKENEQDQKRAAERAAAYQRQLDETMLRFTIDGEDIQISQGDLRKEMKHRVEELEEQKKELQRNGGSPEQISKVDKQIDTYKPIIKDSETNPITPNEIQTLTSQDPVWADRLKNKPQVCPAVENIVSGNMRTSFSNEVFNDSGITAAPLTTTFMSSASPAPAPIASPPAPTLEKQKQNLNSALQATGF